MNARTHTLCIILFLRIDHYSTCPITLFSYYQKKPKIRTIMVSLPVMDRIWYAKFGEIIH